MIEQHPAAAARTAIDEIPHLDLVRAIALAANTACAAPQAFEVALEVICRYAEWPLGVVWDVESRDGAPWLLPRAVYTTDDDGARPALAPISAADAGVVGAVVTTAAPASVWRLSADAHCPLTPSTGGGDPLAAAFSVVVNGEVAAVLQFLIEDGTDLDRAMMAAMETVSLQLSRVVERAQTEAELREREAQARQVMDRATDPFVSMDLDGVVTEWNRRATERFGWSAAEVIGRHVDETLVPPALAPIFAERLTEYRVERSSRLLGRSVLLVLRDREDRQVPVEAWVWASGGRRPLLHAFLRPLEEAPEESLLPRRVRGDAHAAARHRFRGAIDELIATDRWGTVVAVLELDRFWRIREELGTVATDDVLDELAHRLESVLGETGSVVPLGDAQFGIVWRGGGQGDATAFGTRLLELLRRPVTGPGFKVPVDANIGLASAMSVTGDAGALVEAATTALRAAQRRGVGRIEVYDRQVHVRARGQLRLEADLRDAVRLDQLEVHYQPLVELATGHLSGAEALVRWRHPEHGLLGPHRFIDAAERTGVIHELGQEVLRQALEDAARWAPGLSGPKLRLAVNVSGAQLEHDGLPAMVRQLLDDYHVEPGDLTLEVTETVIGTDEPAVLRRLWELRELGVALAMDDFGTGYSSLSRLRALPFDVLKIDRSFVQHITHADEDVPMLRAVAMLARDLDMRIVAEGVETTAQLQAVVRYGCTHVQGFLFAEPLAGADFERSLLRDPTWDIAG